MRKSTASPPYRSGWKIVLQDGKELLVGDINEEGGVCDCCGARSLEARVAQILDENGYILFPRASGEEQ